MAAVIAALIAAVGVRTFLGPCVHDDGTFGACHYAGQALFGISLLLLAEGLSAVLWKQAGTRRGLYLAMIPTAVLGILLPGNLIPLCGMATMRCRALMRPAMTILFVLILAAGMAGAVFSKED